MYLIDEYNKAYNKRNNMTNYFQKLNIILKEIKITESKNFLLLKFVILFVENI